METGLTPDNSDLIALLESQLLGTELQVKGDENTVMADSLLDLGPDTVSLGQSTPVNTVVRVPYKDMHDFQTNSGRLSSELCCKDQSRSNNNSAFVDTTHSDSSETPPLMEVTTDGAPRTTELPAVLYKKSSWVTDETEDLIQAHRGDDTCTTCRLCQQRFTTHRRLWVHIPQHYITTFCPCGEFSYHRDYVLRHQRTMACFTGYLYDVDEHLFPTFLNLIKPCVTDPTRYARLLQGFPPPREITQGPCPAPRGSKKSSKPSSSTLIQTVPRPTTLPRVVLQRTEVPPAPQNSPSSSPLRPSRKRRWHSPSPTKRHSMGARNLREVESRMNELEKEIHTLTPRIAAASTELQALRKSVGRLKREQRD